MWIPRDHVQASALEMHKFAPRPMDLLLNRLINFLLTYPPFDSKLCVLVWRLSMVDMTGNLGQFSRCRFHTFSFPRRCRAPKQNHPECWVT